MNNEYYMHDMNIIISQFLSSPVKHIIKESFSFRRYHFTLMDPFDPPIAFDNSFDASGLGRARQKVGRPFIQESNFRD